MLELKEVHGSTYNLERANWLWERLKDQRACFDDFGKDRGDLFAARFAAANTMAFEYGDSGLVLVESILPRHSAEIHFFLWDKALREKEIADIGRQVVRQAFDVYKLHRMQTMIPAFNQFAQRIATLIGFKYEGTIRQAWLHNGRFFDVTYLGLLAHEFTVH
jgi:RimJ/RimL family protein N-acetyltransferase